MAVRFDAHADRLLYSGTPASMSAYTFACWCRITTDRNDYSNVFAIETNGIGTEWNELMTDSNGTSLSIQDHSSGTAITLGAMTVGTWYFAAFSVGASGAGVGYFAAPTAAGITKTTGTIAVMTAAHHCTIGSTDFSEFFNGRVAGARLWDAVLSDADIEQERWRIAPARLANLRAWWPLHDASSKLVDYSGNARALTSPGAGPWQTEDGPPTLGFPRRRVVVSTPAGGFTGTAAATFDAMTGAAAGTETFTGTASATLGAMTGSAAGTETFTGSGAVTFDAMTGASAGTQTFIGSAAATFDAMTGSAAGAETFTGAGAGTFDAMTGAAAGSQGTIGTAAATLGAMTGAAAGLLTFTGNASSTLAAMTGSAEGTTTVSGIEGAGAATLGAMTGVAAGTVAGVVPTDAWAHYKLDDIADDMAIADASGNGRALFPNYDASGFPKRIAGKVGKARDFSRVNATVVSAQLTYSAFSLVPQTEVTSAQLAAFCDGEWSTCFWFRRRDELPLGAGHVFNFGSMGTQSVEGRRVAMNAGVRYTSLSDGRFQWQSSYFNGSTQVTGLGGTFSNWSPVVGEWVHVSIVVCHLADRLEASLYVDGVLVQTSTSASALKPNFTAYPTAVPTFSVGSRWRALLTAENPAEPIVNTLPLSGAVDDLRIFARELAADEIAAIAALRAPFYGRIVQSLRNGGASAAELHHDATTAALRNAGATSAELSQTATRITLEDP